MKRLTTSCIALIAIFLMVLQTQVPAVACATCGCSELCALNLFGDTNDKAKSNSLLSNSIWGRLILGIAYNRDPELQKLGGRSKVITGASTALLGSAAIGTLPQGVVSLYTLPDSPDSYAPLKIGIPLEGITNLAIYSKMILNAGLRRKIRARQNVVRANVEAILYHLQNSQWGCPEAEKQLSSLIGETAAEECVRLWTISHTLAGSDDANPPKAETVPERAPETKTSLSISAR